MASQRYEPGKGVVALRWEDGTPPSSEHQPYLVEVWRPSINLFGAHPAIRVQAEIEIRVRTPEGAWKELAWGGQLRDVRAGVVKRYAPLAARWWHATINIDGWGK